MEMNLHYRNIPVTTSLIIMALVPILIAMLPLPAWGVISLLWVQSALSIALMQVTEAQNAYTEILVEGLDAVYEICIQDDEVEDTSEKK